MKYFTLSYDSDLVFQDEDDALEHDSRQFLELHGTKEASQERLERILEVREYDELSRSQQRSIAGISVLDDDLIDRS